ncbi:DNA repair protein [Martiniozyma asiatica (nom. inval.)]|nr:DNA repair protein [Martiniozyma asiatica]
MSVAGVKRTHHDMGEGNNANYNGRKRVRDIMTQATPSLIHAKSSGLTEPAQVPSQSGIIEKLELVNFMCHDSFKLSFGPQVNFIIGRNGSGKSAILTGISVALGAKATDTDRGNSLKNLIKHGKNVARAIVYIANRGEMAFKPEEFGEQIIIERVLKSEGSHSISVKSNKKIISSKKSLVDEILKYFGITIANPMTILTQTEAKSFLAHSSDKEKYVSFMTGTRLKESYDNIRSTVKYSEELTRKANEQVKVTMDATERMEKAKAVLNKFEEATVLEKKQQLFLGKNFWSQYLYNKYRGEESQKWLEAREKELKEQIEQLKIQNNELETKKQYINTLVGDELPKLIQLFDIKRAEMHSKKQPLEISKHEMREYQNRIDDIKEEKARTESEMKKCEANIVAEQKKIDSSQDGSVEKLKSSIVLREKQEREHFAKIVSLQEEKDELREKQQTILSEWDSKKIDAKSKLREAEQKLNEARNETQRNNPISAFPKRTQEFIRNLKKLPFKGKVLGPIGLEVELKKEYHNAKWLIQIILQKALGTVLCEKFEDLQKVVRLVKQMGLNNEIVCRDFSTFSFQHECPTVKHPSILDALSIKNDVITCFLVDSSKIHNSLLIKDRALAIATLKGPGVNTNTQVLYQTSAGVNVSYMRNGSLQSDPVNKPKQELIALRTQGADLTQTFQDEYNEAKSNLQKIAKEADAAKQKINTELMKSMSEIDELKKERVRLQDVIRRTQEKVSQLDIDEGVIDNYKEQIMLLDGRLAKYDDQKLQIEQEMMTKLNESEAIERDYIECKNSCKELEQQLSQLKIKIKQNENQLEFINKNITSLDNSITKIEHDKEKLKKFLAESNSNAEGYREKALVQCDLESTGLLELDRDYHMKNHLHQELIESIKIELSKITEDLQRIADQQGISKDQAHLNYIKESQKLQLVKKSQEEIEKLSTTISMGLNERSSNLKHTTSEVIQNVEYHFKSALSIRGFKGELNFDMKNETLTLKVATKEGSQLRSVESLSGGEKSYAQISFLFSIWGHMNSRIRGLDEFDVFMDQINRRIALKLILEKVKRHPQRQTIFITPLSVSGIPGLDDEMVHIHEISPPERQNV